MSSRDATEGGQPDRIPEGAKPSEVIFGNPSVIDELVVKLRAYAGAFKDGKARVEGLSLLDWTGAGAESFQEAIKKLPGELGSAQAYFHAAANALDAYADKLRSVQRRCKGLVEDADEARAQSKRHLTKVEDYNAALERGDDQLPQRPPDTDPGVTAMAACHSRLDTLEAELDVVVQASRRKLEKVARKAPDKPEGKKGWEAWKQRGRDFAGGAADSLLSWGEGLSDALHGGPGGAALRLAGMADGAAYAVEHPKEFAKAVTNWEEWQRNPSRAAGQLTPELLLALASGGAGAARKGASSTKDAAQRLAGRERALGRDGSARERTDGEPGRNETPNGERSKTGEPIDVATGEMVMSDVDVELPGVLPLVLERHYVSGHPCGGWFGATWAATLDQRLELDDTGIVYVTDDGMLLTYPVPEPHVPTLPTSGPRWPLCWDGRPEGSFTVTVPEAGRTLHFAAPVPGGRDLALRAITDRSGDGDRIDVAYDAQGTPTGITHSGGYRLAVDTDPDLLRITALRLLHGQDGERSTTLLSYRYDTAGNLTEVVNSTGLPLRYRYDEQHRITSWTDRNGTSYAYVYDHRGRVLRGIGPDGILSGRLHYDAAARTTRYTDSLGHTTTYVCDEAYKVVERTDPLGHVTRTEWDEDGRHPIAVTDPLGHTTRYTRDEEGRLTAIQRPDGSVTEAVYDHWGLPLQIREPDGALWRHTYDDRGARTSTTDPAGAVTHYTYDTTGHLASVTDPVGHTTLVTCDAAGLPIAVTDPLGHTTRVRRGPHGRITAMIDPLGHTTRQGWTIEGKPAWREHPDGTRERWEWDAEGNLADYTDQAGHTTRHTHTHFDLPATRTDPDGAHYAFTYDTELRLTAVTNPHGHQWHYAYDPAGRLIAETDFNGATRTYELDPAGHLVARTDALGHTLRYTHDAAGRVLSERDSATDQTTTYAYAATGMLLGTANDAAEITLERDPLGRVLAETVNGHTTTYAFDPAGRRIQRTTPSGHTSHWTYDAAGRPTRLEMDGGWLTFTHDDAGRETHRQLGPSVELTQHWGNTNHLNQQTVHGQDGKLLQHRSYTYRPDGYLTEIRELTTGTRHFDLDSAGRVTGVQAHGWSERYAYDAVGNQTEAAAPDHPTPGTREHSGTLIHHAGRTTYEHDVAGRLIHKTRKLLSGQTRTWTYTWNTHDRLIAVTTPDGQEWHYAYDPLGRRISRTGPECQVTTFTWDATRLAEETTPDGTSTTWEYAPGTHRPLVQTDREPLTGDARFHAIITDLTGTPTELLTPDGDVAWQHRTTLWGTPLPAPASTASVSCPLRFPGQYADPETGLHYNYFRYYDPETTHYLTPDPLGLTPAPNPHTYVHNPHTQIDPLGLAPKDCSGTSELAQASKAADTAADNVQDWTPKNIHLDTHPDIARRKAKFDTSLIDPHQIVQEALRSPNANFHPNNLEGTYKVNTDMGHQIGSKGQTGVRVIFSDDGRVINAFPVNVGS